MEKYKVYKYIGYDGTITSPVLLPNIDKIEMIQLYADNGKILINSNGRKSYYVTIRPEEIDLWTEIVDEDRLK